MRPKQGALQQSKALSRGTAGSSSSGSPSNHRDPKPTAQPGAGTHPRHVQTPGLTQPVVRDCCCQHPQKHRGCGAACPGQAPPAHPEDGGIWPNAITGGGDGCSGVPGLDLAEPPVPSSTRLAYSPQAWGPPSHGWRGLSFLLKGLWSSPRRQGGKRLPGRDPALVPLCFPASGASHSRRTPALTRLAPARAEPPSPSLPRPKPPSPAPAQTRLRLTWAAIVHPMGQEQGPAPSREHWCECPASRSKLPMPNLSLPGKGTSTFLAPAREPSPRRLQCCWKRPRWG